MKSSPCDKSFKRPRRLTLMYWLVVWSWVRNVTWIVVLGVFVLIIGLIPFWVPLIFSIDSSGLEASSAALVGALIGVIGGGFGAYYLQSQRYKADTAIRRKYDQYIPLYDALVRFQADIERAVCSYPNQYLLVPGSISSNSNIVMCPYWIDIENSIEYMSIPSWLRTSFVCLNDELREYNENREFATRNFHHWFTKILSDEYNRQNFVQPTNFSHYQKVISQFLANDPEAASEIFRHSKAPDLNSTMYLEMFLKLSTEYRSTDIATRIIETQIRINEHIEWLISELTQISIYVGRRFEESGPYI